MMKLMAFLPSTDLARSRVFLVETMGLELVEESPYAVVLRSGETLLRVTPAADFSPRSFTVLGWQVQDLAAEVEKLESRGVRFEQFEYFEQDDRGIWTGPGGDQVAWFRDPDGNLLSFSQSAEDP